MIKTITFAVLAFIGAAEIPKFPAFDSFHANCALDVTFKGQSCHDVYTKLSEVITKYEGGDVGAGVYAFVDKVDDTYIWTTRTTPVHKYVDDIGFEFATSGSDCQVKAKSRSETLSYYDYSTNYCNMWNVFNGSESAFNIDKVHDCQYPASDPTTTCAKY